MPAISQSTTASSVGGALGREEHVVELVVAVAQRARLIGGAVGLEPVGDPVGGRQLAAAVGVELGEPRG